MEFKLPSRELVIEVHDVALALSGGLEGIPHPEYIDASIHRPENYMSYDSDCTIHLVCAVILDAIARSHAFADANKRTALLTMFLTYQLNDVHLIMDDKTADKYRLLVVNLVSKKPSVKETAVALEVLYDEFRKRTLLDKIIKRG